MTTWGVVVAGGSGGRFGGPKQYEMLGGRRVIDWSLDAAREVCDAVVVVVPRDLDDADEPAADVVVAGSSTRAGSVRRGLAAVPDDAQIVVVHDAARPLASVAVFRRVVAAVADGADGAIPVMELSDTVKRVGGGAVVETIARDGLVAVQTPQAFLAPILRWAHRGRDDATDDAALVEAAGGTVVVVDGDPRNLKVTYPDDLVVAEALLATLGR